MIKVISESGLGKACDSGSRSSLVSSYLGSKIMFCEPDHYRSQLLNLKKRLLLASPFAKAEPRRSQEYLHWI